MDRPPSASPKMTMPQIGGEQTEMSSQAMDQQEDSGSDGEGEVARRSKDDPLAAHVWRLYSRARDSLPNAQRLENMTWRMMAMTLHRKGEAEIATDNVN
ncbi:hypothetical protein BGZ58_008604 [Dissophora ornata]|nr:hypothetical protein BGZ58_008604 [Dissophora ornata]